MKIRSVDYKSKLFWEYLLEVLRIRHILFLFNLVQLRKNAKVYIIEKDGEFIGGTFITPFQFNFLETDLKQFYNKLEHKDILNLSYFCITKNQRRKGYGSKFLRKIITIHEDKFIWLLARTHNKKFYIHNGGKILKKGKIHSFLIFL